MKRGWFNFIGIWITFLLLSLLGIKDTNIIIAVIALGTTNIVNWMEDSE